MWDLNRNYNVPSELTPLKSLGFDPIPDDSDTDDPKFIFQVMRGPISMDRLEYRYAKLEPAYVKNANYEPREYDINIYSNRIKEGGYISNPFAFESTWK